MSNNTNVDQARESAAINIHMSGNAQLNLNGPFNYADHGSANTVTTTAPATTDTKAKTPFWKSSTFWTAVAALATVAGTVVAVIALK
ncbi:hypothetical protein [Kitasatospora griseola]|uniref:hypothetical protein n=1 Tax=Kitasatospora griseola TaxID=2064 RepID=UPI0016706681|nr:hypothetical protein [Kitasatospora griseola]GGR05538.1 hypothetical protein GCM10010195_71050 [Kitasatospora griseola]